MSSRAGVLAGKVKKQRQSVLVKGDQTTEVLVKIDVLDYVDELVDQSAMKIFLMGRIRVSLQFINALISIYILVSL